MFDEFVYVVVFRMNCLSCLLTSTYLCDTLNNYVYLSTCRKHFPILSSFMTYHRVCNQINTRGVTSGGGTNYPSGAPEFTPVFSGVRVTRFFCFLCMFSRSLFVLLQFSVWPMCCLVFFDIRILITPLASSNFVYFNHI